MEEIKDPKELTGVQKTAILLLTMGDEYVQKIFKELDRDEIVKVSKAMVELETVPQEIVEAVLTEFHETFLSGKRALVGGPSQAKRILSKVLDGESVEDIMKRLETEHKPPPFKGLENYSPNIMARILANEHPQTLALILGHLPPHQAAEVLKNLPPGVRPEVLLRLAKLESVPLEMLYEVDFVLREQLEAMGGEGQKVGGVQAVAEILNATERSIEEEVLAEIETESPQMAEEIRELMFVFEDIKNLDDRSIRELLKEISNEDLTLALKGASDELKEKFFSNLSERAATMIKEDLEIMGPVRLSDVEQAQRNIVRIVRQLEAEGRIVIAGKGGEDVLI
ncbi:flagellar motor switch protein FliG [Desulfothermus naphthae]